MNLISEDYLMHYGVKGMKWGVRHDPRVQSSKDRLNRAYAKRNKIGNESSKQLLRPATYKRGTQANKKSNELYRQQQKANIEVSKALEDYNSIKRLVKNEKKISKYSNKAKAQADWARNTAKDINKNGDWEDKEFFDSLSPSEKKAEWARSRKVASQYMKDAKYWDKAVKDISGTKNKKEAKNLYKKYRNNAPYYGFGI